MTFNIQVKALEQFIALAAVGNLGRAAAELGMSQPGLSRAIQKLERDLGYELLRRHSKGVVLTERGRKLQDITGSLVASLIRLSAPPSIDNAEMKRITVGLSSTLSASVVDLLFQAKTNVLPNAALSIVELESDLILEATLADRVDASLIYNPPKLKELRSFPVATDNMIVVFPASWQSKNLTTSSIRDLAKLPSVMLTKNQSERQLIDRVFGRSGVNIRPILELNNCQTLMGAVKSGIGYSVISRQSCLTEIACGSVIHLEVDRPSFPMTLCVNCLKTRSDDPASEIGSALLMQAVQAAIDIGRWGHMKSLASDVGAQTTSGSK